MLCLLTAAGVLAATVAADAFTLAWTHSVEKVDWEEDWRLSGGRLVAVAARVRGSGAGMEPPPGAVLEQGWWRYRPDLEPQPRLVLSRSPYAADYRLCWAGDCRPLSDLVPLGTEPTVTTIEGCRSPVIPRPSGYPKPQ